MGFEPAVDAFVFSREDLMAAMDVVRLYFAATPQMVWPLLCKGLGGTEVWVKHENHLPPGAFKVLGGVVLIHALMRGKYGDPPTGIITASVATMV